MNKLIFPMKAITIWQPWATLIALLEKQNETRSWDVNYRGPLAIHAAQKIDRIACSNERIKHVLAKHGYTAENLPTASVIAIAQLSDVSKITRPYGNTGLVRQESLDTGKVIIWDGDMPTEFDFGDYTDGRFAWNLSNVQTLDTPIPAKGQQRLWNWNINAHL